MSFRPLNIAIGIAAGIALFLAPGAQADDLYIVNSTADAVDDIPGDGVCHTAGDTCTLRAAVMEANHGNGFGQTTIQLPAGIYTLTIPIGSLGEDGEERGDLNLTSPGFSGTIAILGAGASQTIIDANLQSRVLRVESNREAMVSEVQLRNGLAGNGGAIHNAGTLTASRCVIAANEATGYGGGILNDTAAFLTVRHSTIISNDSGYGGGLYSSSGTVRIDQSTVSGNVATEGGGGISNAGTLFVSLSTISGNEAGGHGGGILHEGPGLGWVYNSTIAFNDADSDQDHLGTGGGVFNSSAQGFNVRNSVVAGNTRQGTVIFSDCQGLLNSYGRTKLWVTTGCTISQPTGVGDLSLLGSLEELGPLQFNGGPTRTHALVFPSDMIEGGEPTQGCVGSDGFPLAFDQRGGSRIAGVRCDIGAFEFGALPENLIFADGFEAGDSSAW